MRSPLLLLGALLIGQYTVGQDCAKLIRDSKIISGTHIVSTQKMSLVVRAAHAYEIEFFAHEYGIFAHMTSVGGSTLNLNDRVAFIDSTMHERAFSFGSGIPGIAIYQNNLQLDLDAIKWLAGTTISSVHLTNFVDMQKYKYEINSNAQIELRNLCICFLNALPSGTVTPESKSEQHLTIVEASKPNEASQQKIVTDTIWAPRRVQNELSNEASQQKNLTEHRKEQEIYEKYPTYLKKAMELLGEEPNRHNSILSQQRYLEGNQISRKIAGESNATVRDSLMQLAKRKYLEAIDLEPGAAHIYHAVGSLYFANNPARTDSVLFWHSKAMENAPTWLLPYLDLSYEYMLSAQDRPKSEYWLKKALEKQPHAYVVLERLSWLYLWENRTQESLALCDTMIAWRPDLFNAHSTKGVACMLRNELAEAEACFRQSIEMEPGMHNWANAFHNQLLVMMRRWPQAKTSLDQAIVEKTMDNSARSEILHETLLPLCFQDKIVEAKPYFEKLIALQASPRYIAAGLTGLGIISYKKGRLREAEAYLAKSLNTDSRLPQNALVCNVHLALIAEKQGKAIQADRLFKTAFKSVQDISALDKSIVYASCRLAYGQFLIRRQRYGDAREQFRLAEKFQPKCFQAQYGYALLASAGKRNNEAVDYLEKAFKYWYPEPEPVLEEPLFKKIRQTKRFKDLLKEYFPEQYKD